MWAHGRANVGHRSPISTRPLTLHLHSTPVDAGPSTGQFGWRKIEDPYHSVLWCCVVTYGAELVREDLRSFAEELRRLIALRGMSQAHFADLINVSSSAVSNWTNGRQRPTVANIEAAEDLLSVKRGHLARYLGYLPVADSPPVETHREFLERDGQLSPSQQAVLNQIYEEFLRASSGGKRRRGER